MTLLTKWEVRFPPLDDLLFRDTVENTWWFTIDADDTPTALTQIGEALATFYNGVHDGIHSISECISNICDRSAGLVRIHLMDEATNTQVGETIEAPFSYSDAFNDVSFPAEVALCCSFKNTSSGSPIPPRRRRGRVYIGPLVLQDYTADSNNYSRPDPRFVGLLAQAGTNLLADSNATAFWTWVVYSRAQFLAFPVTDGWVDDEWDTQRRRGRDASTRELWPA